MHMGRDVPGSGRSVQRRSRPERLSLTSLQDVDDDLRFRFWGATVPLSSAQVTGQIYGRMQSNSQHCEKTAPGSRHGRQAGDEAPVHVGVASRLVDE